MDMSAAPRNVGKRARSRLRVELAGKFMTTGDKGECTLLDLSRAGAQIWLGKPIKVGADVLVVWREHELFGTVAWFSEGRCGVAFDEALSEQVVLAARNSMDPHERVIARAAAHEWVQGQLRSGTGD